MIKFATAAVLFVFVLASAQTPASAQCVSNYSDAVKSMNEVAASLLQTQQIFTAAFQNGTISEASYDSGMQSLALIRLDNNDARDIIRIAAASTLITQNISFVNAEVGTLSGILGSSASLQSNVTTLVTSMQTSLGQANKLVSTSACATIVP